MQGAGWAPHPLAREFGVVCVGVPASTVGSGSERLGGKAQQAPWAGVFGAPFRARVLRGLDRGGGGGASRGPGGEARAPPLAHPRSVSFWKRRAPGRGWTQGLSRSWCPPRVSWFPACLVHRCFGVLLIPHPEVRSSPVLAFPVGQFRCGSCGGLEQWAGLGDVQSDRKQSGRTFKTPTLPPVSVAAQYIVENVIISLSFVACSIIHFF